MNVPMQAPNTPQHDLVAMTAALRGALLQRVEQGIQASGLQNYFFYLIGKRLAFDGSASAAALAGQLRLDALEVQRNLDAMLERGLVSPGDGVWTITAAGRRALSAANESGSRVLVEIRSAIGDAACDQLVTGMREALCALRKAA